MVQNGIEFKSSVTEKDVLKYYQEKMFRSKWFYLYFVLLFVGSAIIVLAVDRLRNRTSFEDYIGLLFFACIISFAWFAFRGKSKYKSFYLPESEKITFVNDIGFGTRTDGTEILYKWKMVTSIEETDSCIIFHIKKKCRVFFKNSLPSEVVNKFKDILRTVPVETISLRS